MSGPCCSVGARPDASAIDAALRGGGSVRKVAAAFPGLKPATLGGHRKKCLGLTGRVDEQEPEEPGERPPATPEAGSPIASAEPSQEAARARRQPSDSGSGTAQTPAGRAGEGVQETAQTSGDSARARVDATPSGPEALVTPLERSLHIADLIASDRWRGRPTAKRLAAIWKVEHSTIWNYHERAVTACAADRGDLEAKRETALARIERDIRGARAEGDYKAVAILQQEWDRVAGLVQAGTTVNVNVMQVPGVPQFLREVYSFLTARFPEAATALREHLMAKRSGQVHEVHVVEARALPREGTTE